MDRRKLLGIVGTVILGALGSGLWELLKPVGASAWNAALTIATLGLDSLRDGLYQSAARLGTTGARNALTLQLVSALILLSTSSAMMRLRFLPPERGLSRPLVYYFLPFLLLGGALATMTSAIRIAYVGKVAVYYEQLSTIAAPYVDTQARLELASRVTRAQGRTEYVAVLTELEQLLKTKAIKFPRQELY